jgi:hypothetical protein
VATFTQATGHDKLQAHLHKTDGNKHQCPAGNNGRMYARHLCKYGAPCMPDSAQNLGSAVSI